MEVVTDWLAYISLIRLKLTVADEIDITTGSVDLRKVLAARK